MIVLPRFRVSGLHTETHEERSEHCENIGLKERHQELEHADAEDKEDRNRHDEIRFEKKYQPQERHDDEMPSRHVREKTYAEGKGLREKSENFNRQHDGPERPVDPSREVSDIVPKALRTYC